MLKKLSLAALIAMGSMSVASATPLTEAIKGVDLSGYLRLRVYNDKAKKSDAVNRYRTTALFKFTTPVSEDLKFVTAYAFDWNVYSGATTKGSSNPNNVKFFLKYSKNNLTALVGKIPVPSPVTATGVGEATAAGAIALYKVNDNVTVAAAGLDALVGIDGAALKFKPKATGSNVYAGAVLFNQNNISAEAWYFNVKDAVDSDVVLRATFKTNGIKLHADFATASLDDKNVATSLHVSKAPTGLKLNKTQTYFNVSGEYAQDALSAKVGYVATGKDGGVVVLDGDSPLASVLPTPQKTGIANTVDDNAFYAKVGYKVDPKTSVYLAYSDADKSFDNEIAVGGSYKYTKKMKISAYYSVLNNKGTTPDNNEGRVEFKYSF